MNNKNNFLFDIIVLIGLLIIFSYFDIRICPFFYFFKIPCPGCGLSRSVICLLNFDLVSSLKYNILGIPLIICCFIYFLLIIFNKSDLMNKFVIKNKIFIILVAIIILIIVEFININNPLLY